MSNVTLFGLAGQYRQDLETLGDMDLPDDVVRDTLEGMGGDLEVKAQNVIAYTRHLDKLAEAMKDEERRMSDRRKAVEARSERIRKYVLNSMQHHGIQRIECPWFTLSIAKNPPSVVIEDDRLIPQDFYTSPLPPPPSIDKKLIAQAIKDGYDVPGAKMSQGVRLAVK